jgi:ornithine carbamoyltransferase
MSPHPAASPALELARQRHALRGAHRPRSLLSMDDLDAAELGALVASGLEMKRRPADYAGALAGTSIALLFQKTSTRTRCAFEAAAREMGGHASYLDWARSNFVLADLRDEAIVLSRFHDLVVARVDRHETLRLMADFGEVPVVNGLCDLHHPCQAISDMLTLREYFGADLRGLRLAWLGDANNVCRSLVQAATRLGIETTICAPAGHRLDEATLRAAGPLAREADDPRAAVAGVDVVYTDTWVSMGQEHELAERLARFAPLRVDARLMEAAGPQALFMHCLPAHPGQEVTAEVLRSPRSIVFDQAENRKHAQKALLLWLRRVNRAAAAAPAALAA